MESEDVSEVINFQVINFQARRVAAAFGATISKCAKEDNNYCYVAHMPMGLCVIYAILPSYQLLTVAVFHPSVMDVASAIELRVSSEGAPFWEWMPHPQLNEPLARGLYCLAFDAEVISANLNYSLSAHEKLELRLSMPREFWPQKWLEEAQAKST